MSVKVRVHITVSVKAKYMRISKDKMNESKIKVSKVILLTYLEHDSDSDDS